MHRKLWACPEIWPGQTVTILGSGPSLCDDDIKAVGGAHADGRTRVVVLNSTFREANWADLLYGCDAAWWNANIDALVFAGLRIGLSQVGAESWPDEVKKLKLRQGEGLDHDARYLAGRNSGHQAINLAVHLGAAKIVLLGFDFGAGPDGRRHHHGDHPPPLKNPTPAVFADWCRAIETIVEPLRALGIVVVNCSTTTALTCFPRASIEVALSPEE